MALSARGVSIAAIGLVAFSELAMPQTKPISASLERTMTDSIVRLMQRAAIPGLEIAVISDAHITWVHSFGVADRETREPVTDSTVFEAASLSKPLFAIEVMRLAEQGRLDLSQPLVRYFDTTYARDPRVRRVTAANVLSHTTGFPNWRPGAPIGDLPMFFEPGSRWSYSGEGIVFLQRTVEHVVHEPLETFMERDVFTPLGLRHSRYDGIALGQRMAKGYDAAGNLVAASRTDPNAARSLRTTARDYARVLAAMMDDRGILKRASIDAMLTPHARVQNGCSDCTDRADEDRSEDVQWGLGWGLEPRVPGRWFWQWGDNGSFRAFAIGSADRHIGFVYLTNSANGLSIAPALARLVTGIDHPALSWLDYETVDAPSRDLFQSILTEGFDSTIRTYRERIASGAPRIPEKHMNDIGYRLLRMNRAHDAIVVFQLNVEAYPRSSNVYDSLGEAYLSVGDSVHASRNYHRSVELNPRNATAAELLKRLPPLP